MRLGLESYGEPDSLSSESEDDLTILPTMKVAFLLLLFSAVASAATSSHDFLRRRDTENECCKNDYECPDYSYRRDDRDCYDTFGDCKCDHGYKKQNGYCVPKHEGDCANDVVCPAYSWRKSGQDCYDTFAADCQCDHGYKKQNGQCVPKQVGNCANDFHCPEHAWRIPGKNCYNHISDCRCEDGYIMKNHQCVPKNHCEDCYSDYQCPDYSYPTSDCPYDFGDCYCWDGYHKEGQYCVPDCANDYVCPPNSSYKSSSTCWDSIDDCRCHDGYEKWGEYCVAKFCKWDYLDVGECCKEHSDCKNGDCGSPEYGAEDYKICCPYGKLQYQGHYYCKDMPGGTACYTNSMCASGYCDDGYCRF